MLLEEVIELEGALLGGIVDAELIGIDVRPCTIFPVDDAVCVALTGIDVRP